MLGFGVILLVAAVVAVPPVSKSRDEIEAFRNFLESGRTSSGVRIGARQAENPKAKAWENSGKYQGDILLDDWQVEGMVEEFATGRNAYIWPNTKWPNNVVVYEFAQGHFSRNDQEWILANMRHIEEYTCIRFRLRNNNDRNYVRITAFTDGCYANVGYWASRGIHTLNLAWPGCSLHTTIVHEWLHVLGFMHMQSTYNRDNYVRIMWENIWPGSGVRIGARQAENPKAKAWENSGKYQGDILLDDWQVEGMVEEFATGRNAYIWPNTKWPNNVVVYEFAQGHFSRNDQEWILANMRHIEEYTCIRFRLRNNNDRNYVRITAFTDGCYANVGYWASRGIHTLNLAWPGCSLHTTIVHEWLHVLGFMHMQSTYNRDNYVRIMWENIWPGMEHNFDKYDSNLVHNMGLPYEYGSCMHYGGYGFSTNGRPTMVALYDHAGVMGQQEYVTWWDYLRVRRHYNCPGAWNANLVEQTVAPLNGGPMAAEPAAEEPLAEEP